MCWYIYLFIIVSGGVLSAFILDLGPTMAEFDLDGDLLDLSINDPQTAAFTEVTLIEYLVSDKVVNFKAIKAILLGVWDFGSKI